MIRVGVIVQYIDGGWVGGLNYFINLFQAVYRLKSREIEFVLFTGPDATLALDAFPPGVEVVRSKLLAATPNILTRTRKITTYGFGIDFLLLMLLRKSGIQVLSHSGSLGRRASFPTIGWIPDFQHVRMPQFFTRDEFAKRDRGYRRIANECSVVLLSSFDAQSDLQTYSPTAVSRSRVLQFVSGVQGQRNDLIVPDIAKSRYNITGAYYFLPNQFWAHKNHRVVVDALLHLRRQGRSPQVVCTGNTQDSRQPEYFHDLLAYVNEKGLQANFTVLGLIPYADVVSLMCGAVAVINPSLFEGWSTSVEEVKSLGLRALLSDIPVHREQNSGRALYFEPTNPEDLASKMIEVDRPVDEEEERRHRSSAAHRLQERFLDFGHRYQQIVVDLLDTKSRTR